MDGLDPAKKQYILFSAVIALILSFIINFLLIEGVKGTFAYGFPINLNELTGFGEFISRVVNTVVMGAFLTIPTFIGLMWMQRQR